MAITYEREISDKDKYLIQRCCRICNNYYAAREVDFATFEKELESKPEASYAMHGNTESLTEFGYCGCQDNPKDEE